MHIIDYGSEIPGLLLIQNFVTSEEETSMIEDINKNRWCGLGISPNPELKRRTQQYGHLFSYRYRKVLEELGPLPEFSRTVVERIMKNDLMPNTPNHLLVNEYNLGQGIMPHTDAPALFGPTILSLSLLSACVMKFTHVETGHTVDILLPRLSMVVMRGHSRYTYKHSISKDHIETASDGTAVHRDRRVSLTFRGKLSIFAFPI
ncbi:hypothetical protein BDC45DRAFT_437668 [Circinella umbellata]|nr:hypothetical protein BDC45DRAFT_437668 [Circinella umbellata]